MTSLYGSQTSPVDLCSQNSVRSARITGLHGSHPSSVVLYIENSDFITRITSLYGSQTSLVDLCSQNSMRSARITGLHGSQPSSAFFACKTETLGPELYISTGPRPNLLFLQAKRRL